MKYNTIKSITIVLLLMIGIKVNAQETVTIPLSNPSKEGLLKIGIINGSITVKGTDTKEVIVTGTRREGGNRYYSGRKTSKNDVSGLKRISNNSLEFSAEEYDNEVHVRSSPQGTTDFEIEVPKNFSLKV